MNRERIQTQIKVLFEEPHDSIPVIEASLHVGGNRDALVLEPNSCTPRITKDYEVISSITIDDILYGDPKRSLFKNIKEKRGVFYIQTEPEVPVINLESHWWDNKNGPSVWQDRGEYSPSWVGDLSGHTIPKKPEIKQQTFWWKCKYNQEVFEAIQKTLCDGKIDTKNNSYSTIGISVGLAALVLLLCVIRYYK
jgi:hypothetical protein